MSTFEAFQALCYETLWRHLSTPKWFRKTFPAEFFFRASSCRRDSPHLWLAISHQGALDMDTEWVRWEHQQKWEGMEEKSCGYLVILENLTSDIAPKVFLGMIKCVSDRLNMGQITWTLKCESHCDEIFGIHVRRADGAEESFPNLGGFVHQALSPVCNCWFLPRMMTQTRFCKELEYRED